MFITLPESKKSDSFKQEEAFANPKIRQCESIYTKSNNQDVLSEFVKIVDSLQSNIH